MGDKNNETEKIKQLEERLLELENNWKRAVADYRNLERRVTEEKEHALVSTNAYVQQSYLPILDMLESAFSQNPEEKWIELAIKEFKTIHKNFMVEEIDALGKDFDPNFMEAIDTAPGKKNLVVEVVRKGYLAYKDKVIRPVVVTVGNGEGA